MDYQTLVSEEKEAGLRLVQLIHGTHPVKVAFWLKQEVESPWKLFIGGEWVEFQHSREAFKVVLEAIDQLNDSTLELPRTSVIPLEHSLARAALDFWKKYPGVLPTWSNDSRFGEMSVERVYLYPERMIKDPEAKLFARPRDGAQAWSTGKMTSTNSS